MGFKYQCSCKKWLILRLGLETYVMSLEHPVGPESKEVLKNKRKTPPKPILMGVYERGTGNNQQGFYLPKLEQFEK